MGLAPKCRPVSFQAATFTMTSSHWGPGSSRSYFHRAQLRFSRLKKLKMEIKQFWTKLWIGGGSSRAQKPRLKIFRGSKNEFAFFQKSLNRRRKSFSVQRGHFYWNFFSPHERNKSWKSNEDSSCPPSDSCLTSWCVGWLPLRKSRIAPQQQRHLVCSIEVF